MHEVRRFLGFLPPIFVREIQTGFVGFFGLDFFFRVSFRFQNPQAGKAIFFSNRAVVRSLKILQKIDYFSTISDYLHVRRRRTRLRPFPAKKCSPSELKPPKKQPDDRAKRRACAARCDRGRGPAPAWLLRAAPSLRRRVWWRSHDRDGRGGKAGACRGHTLHPHRNGLESRDGANAVACDTIAIIASASAQLWLCELIFQEAVLSH